MSVSYSDGPDARGTLWALAAELHRHGIDRLYAQAGPALGVLSVSADITVWSNGRNLTWRHAGTTVTWPAADPHGAARQITHHLHTGVRQNAADPADPEL